jgi:hypothetical protein
LLPLSSSRRSPCRSRMCPARRFPSATRGQRGQVTGRRGGGDGVRLRVCEGRDLRAGVVVPECTSSSPESEDKEETLDSGPSPALSDENSGPNARRGSNGDRRSRETPAVGLARKWLSPTPVKKKRSFRSQIVMHRELRATMVSKKGSTDVALIVQKGMQRLVVVAMSYPPPNMRALQQLDRNGVGRSGRHRGFKGHLLVPKVNGHRQNRIGWLVRALCVHWGWR